MIKEETAIEIGWNLDNSYARLPEFFFSLQNPTPVPSPQLAALNRPLAKALGLDIQNLASDEGVAFMAGNALPKNALPLAQAYAGHQFGHFTMLGDGRAILLGEQITPTGQRFDIQLKGSGRTPYSRGGDGRAALGPMLREYIISEAMNALGIPTTRSLAVVTTGETVIRETELPGAILTRIASSHLRVGTFEYVAQWGSLNDLRALADYALQRHFSEVPKDENQYLQLLHGVIERQAALIAQWLLVGFIHGVMNTDNMAISGETIDYGPCAFMDTYDPATFFSSIDRYGRYAYGNQPHIAAWNLARLAETLLPLLHEDSTQAIETAEGAIASFIPLFRQYWLKGMRAKIGLFDEDPSDESLIESLLRLMKKHHADYTNTFNALLLDTPDNSDLFHAEEFLSWLESWRTRRDRQQAPTSSIRELMQKSNPAIIPRNHRVEEALNAAVNHGDLRVMDRLMNTLAHPYAHSSEQLEYSTPPEPSDRPYRTFCGT